MPAGIRPPVRARRADCLVAATLLLACPASGSPGLEARRLVAEEPHAGTLVRIEACFPSGVNPPGAFRAAFDRVAEIERCLSSYLEHSELRRLEPLAWRHAVPVSPDLGSVLAMALKLARDSQGAFDPTLGRVTRLLRAFGWGRQGPEPATLRAALRHTGWRHVELGARGRAVFIGKRGITLDLGGVAKGYIADQALAELARLGIDRAIVSVGGDVAVGEAPPGDPGWRVALDAAGGPGTPERTLVLRKAGVSTSGSRERYYLSDGRRCSHIAETEGDTCGTAELAVSVVAADAATADGLATALAAMGPAKGRALLGRHPRVRAYWVPEGGSDAPTGARVPARGFSQR